MQKSLIYPILTGALFPALLSAAPVSTEPVALDAPVALKTAPAPAASTASPGVEEKAAETTAPEASEAKTPDTDPQAAAEDEAALSAVVEKLTEKEPAPEADDMTNDNAGSAEEAAPAEGEGEPAAEPVSSAVSPAEAAVPAQTDAAPSVSDADATTKSEAAPAENASAEPQKETAPGAARPVPLAVVPPFLDFMPYVTTLKDVEEVFGKQARLYDEGRLGKRHIITGQDFDLGVSSVLVSYTDDGLVSDVFMRAPGEKRPDVLRALQDMAAGMNPDGIWAKDGERDFWYTKTAVLSVGPVKNGDFSIEYGATAREVRETRAWLEEAPLKRAPRFAGVLIGWSTIEDLAERVKPQGCEVGKGVPLKDGDQIYTLRGACFGLPGEYQSLVWQAADSGRVMRLIIESKGDPVGFGSVLPALQKRYVPTGREGEFRTAEAPARNIWPPLVRFSAKDGRLEFYAAVDGVKKAEAYWDVLLKEKLAREAQAKRVDSLFE